MKLEDAIGQETSVALTAKATAALAFMRAATEPRHQPVIIGQNEDGSLVTRDSWGHPPPQPVKLGDVVEDMDAHVYDLSGYCRRCGRTLKVAKWVALGIGPICAKKEAKDAQMRFLDARGALVDDFDSTGVPFDLGEVTDEDRARVAEAFK